MEPQYNLQKNNPILEKSFAFAVRAVKLSQFLQRKKEFTIAKQVIRSGTAVGALVHEAQQAESRRDFVHKLAISLKEANETMFWLRLLVHSGLINTREYSSLHQDIHELVKLLTSIIRSTKANQI